MVVRPEGPGRFPGVLHFPDIGGERPSQRAMARRLAAKGFAVLVVNPFHRTGDPPFMAFPPDWNDPAIKKKFAELAGPVTPEAAEHDGGAFVDFLTGQPWTSPGRVGAVGYCFGGALALRASAARPEKVGAVASFHGGGLFKDDPSSPHRVLPRVKARLYFAHAVEDASMTPSAVAGLEAALKDWGGDWSSETYAGARHGWTVPDSAAFDPAAADRAFAVLSGLMTAALP